MKARDSRGRPSGHLRPIGVTKGGKRISVIVVDDEYVHRRLIAQMLQSVGFDVVGEAQDGMEGLALFKEKKPQIVVLDVNMPKLNGKKTLGLITQSSPGAIVVMCTGMDDKNTVMALLEAGASDYILKPLDRPAFVKKMAELVERHGLDR